MKEQNGFKVGDTIKYDNGTHQETFTIYSIGEHHLYSTEYNTPSFSKKYCNKLRTIKIKEMKTADEEWDEIKSKPRTLILHPVN